MMNNKEQQQEEQEQQEQQEDVINNKINENIDEDKQEEIIQSLPFDGITISQILAFIERCGGREVFDNLTIEKVVDNFIRPLTSLVTTTKSYCQMLKEQNNENNEIVKVANRYLSITQLSIFLDTVDLLVNKYHNQNDLEIVIWWDIFSIDQHKHGYIDMKIDTDIKTWSSTYQTLIESINHTIFPIISWNNINSINDVWCLFEAYFTITLPSAKLEIITSIQADNEIIQSFINNTPIQLQKLSRKLDILSILKTNNAIHRSLINIMKSFTCGMIHLKKTFSNMIVNYIINLIMNEFQQTPQNKQYNYVIGILYYQQEDYQNAEIHCKISCEDDLDNLTKLNQLALVYLKQKRFQEATELFTTCFNSRKEILGVNHLDTIDSMFNLGMAYHQQINENIINNKRVEDDEIKAESLLKKCYKLRNQILGQNHLDTIKSGYELGLYYYDNDNYIEAEPVLKDTVKSYYQLVGIKSELTIESLNTLTLLLIKKEKYLDALNHLLEIYNYTEEVHGHSSEFKFEIMYRISNLYINLQNNEKSESFIKKCRELSVKEGNSQQKFRARTIYSFARLMINKKKYDLANQMFEESYSLLSNETPEPIEEMINCLNYLAVLSFNRENYEKSLELLNKGYELIQQKEHVHKNNNIIFNSSSSLMNLKYRIMNLIEMKNYESASELNEKYYLACFSKFGKENRKTIASIKMFLIIHEATNNDKKMIQYLKLLLEINEKIYGAPHCETVAVKYQLSQLYLKNGQQKKADELTKTFRMCSMNVSNNEPQKQIEE